MTSKLVVNTIEADTGISSVSFASSISLSSTSVFHFSDAGVNIGADTNISRAGNGILAFNINSSEKVRIDSNGRLSIGGENAGHFYSGADNLVVADFSADAGISIFGGGSNKSYIAMGSTTFGTGALEAFIEKTHGNNNPLTIATQVGNSNIELKSANDFIFSSYSGPTERLRITSAGKVLIGTSTPQGNANADDLVVSTSGHSGITIRSGTSSNGNIFFADGTSGGDEYRGVIDYNHSSNHMSFSTNAVERVRIDSSGNLMINSSSAEAKLDVVGGVAISSNGVPVSPSGYDLKIRSNTAKLGIHIDNASGTPILEFGIGGATGGRITTNTNAGPIIIAPNNVERLRIAADGQILPGADDAQNLGSSTKRWKNIYAADMHFSNEGKTNDVDGTWGDWTLQEGEDSVFMINNRTGKKYAITMREVN